VASGVFYLDIRELTLSITSNQGNNVTIEMCFTRGVSFFVIPDTEPGSYHPTHGHPGMTKTLTLNAARSNKCIYILGRISRFFLSTVIPDTEPESNGSTMTFA
jgi:hypothetical protein